MAFYGLPKNINNMVPNVFRIRVVDNCENSDNSTNACVVSILDCW